MQRMLSRPWQGSGKFTAFLVQEEGQGSQVCAAATEALKAENFVLLLSEHARDVGVSESGWLCPGAVEGGRLLRGVLGAGGARACCTSHNTGGQL